MKKIYRLLSLLLSVLFILTVSLPVAAAAGDSADNPVVCTNLIQLKTALERSDIKYVRLQGNSSENVNYFSVTDVTEMHCLENSGCSKHLEIRGTHNAKAVNYINDCSITFLMAYNNLTIDGDGTLNVDIENSNPDYYPEFYKYNSAFGVGVSTSLTINGGTYSFSRHIRTMFYVPESSKGVFINGGTFNGPESFIFFDNREGKYKAGEKAVISGGTFTYNKNFVENFFGDRNKNAYDCLRCGTVKNIESDEADQFAAASEYVKKVSAGSGYYDIVPNDKFAFTVQPQGGTVKTGRTITVQWATNKKPEKLELKYISPLESSWSEIDKSLTDYVFANTGGGDSVFGFRLRATYGSKTVESENFYIRYVDSRLDVHVALQSDPAGACSFYGIQDGKSIKQPPFIDTEMKEGAEMNIYAVPADGYRIAFWRVNGKQYPVTSTVRANLRLTVADDTAIECVLEKINGCPTKGYTDVPGEGNWAHAGIDFCVAQGLMGSTSTASLVFEPATKVNRAMVAAILYRMAGSPAVTYSGKFKDVPNGKWFSNAIEWCAQNGLAMGKGAGIFDPNGFVTRQELAAFTCRMADYCGIDVSGRANLNGFADAGTVPGWAKENVRWAVYAGLISGKTAGGKNILAPADNATRAELAAIIMRFVGNVLGK